MANGTLPGSGDVPPPDIMLLQELKLEGDEKVTHAKLYLKSRGYHSVFGQAMQTSKPGYSADVATAWSQHLNVVATPTLEQANSNSARSSRLVTVVLGSYTGTGMWTTSMQYMKC